METHRENDARNIVFGAVCVSVLVRCVRCDSGAANAVGAFCCVVSIVSLFTFHTLTQTQREHIATACVVQSRDYFTRTHRSLSAFAAHVCA